MRSEAQPLSILLDAGATVSGLLLVPAQPRACFGVVGLVFVGAGADHAFHVLARSGRNDAAVIEELADATARWTAGLARG